MEPTRWLDPIWSAVHTTRSVVAAGEHGGNAAIEPYMVQVRPTAANAT